MLCSPDFHHCAASSHRESNTPGQQRQKAVISSKRLRSIFHQNPSNEPNPAPTGVSLFSNSNIKRTQLCVLEPLVLLWAVPTERQQLGRAEDGAGKVCSRPQCAAGHSSAPCKALALLLPLLPRPSPQQRPRVRSCPCPSLTQHGAQGTPQGLLLLPAHRQGQCATASST